MRSSRDRKHLVEPLKIGQDAGAERLLRAIRGLSQSHALPADTPVALETGTSSFYAARLLADLRLRLVVIDAHEVRLKAQRPAQKSDRRDAFELCDGLRRGIYRAIVHVPPLAISRLRTTLSRRRHFVRIQTAEANATKRLLRGAGWRAGTQASLRSAGSWERLLAALGAAPELHGHLRLHRAVWQGPALDHHLGELARDWRDEVHRLEAVPGVGPIVALTAIAVFADVHRFASARHVASYAGLVPSTYQSGAADRHGHITKRGAAELRTMLCEAAHHARRPAHPRIPHFATACARRGYTIAIGAIAHRLCRLLYALLRDGAEFQPARLGGEGGPFTQTITRRFRLTPKSAGRLTAVSCVLRSPARPRCACDPVLPRGPRAQEPVWGQARRNTTWGEHDPEWTAGDDAGPSATAFPIRVFEPRTTGPPGPLLTSGLHGWANSRPRRFPVALTAAWSGVAAARFVIPRAPIRAS